jgi:coniferyl-aldehyde dehydrogenase
MLAKVGLAARKGVQTKTGGAAVSQPNRPYASRSGQKQRAFTAALCPNRCRVRRDRIDRAIACSSITRINFAKAVSADFGHRSTEQTLMTDIMPSVSAIKHAKKHFESWAKGERRKPTFPLGLIGAKAEVIYQPKGVVGVIAPWNFPIGMVMVPMAGISGGGQPGDGQASEYTERVADLFAEAVPQIFRRRGNGGVHRRGGVRQRLSPSSPLTI